MTIKFLRENREYIDVTFLNPFFLDKNSKMLSNPRYYGIENIRAIDSRAQHDPELIQDVTDTYYYPYAFDEINGLKWRDKKKQIIEFEKRYHDEATFLFWSNESIAMLFHLYDTFGDKAIIKKIYNKWANLRIAHPVKNVSRRSEIKYPERIEEVINRGSCVPFAQMR